MKRVMMEVFPAPASPRRTHLYLFMILREETRFSRGDCFVWHSTMVDSMLLHPKMALRRRDSFREEGIHLEKTTVIGRREEREEGNHREERE